MIDDNFRSICNKDGYAIVHSNKENYLSLQFPFGYLHLAEFKKENITNHSAYYDNGNTASFHIVKEIGFGECKKEFVLTRMDFGGKSIATVNYEGVVINVPEFFADKLAMFLSGFLKYTEVESEA